MIISEYTMKTLSRTSLTVVLWMTVSVFLQGEFHLVSAQMEPATNVPETKVDCQQRLITEMYTCVSNQGIDFNLFLVNVGDFQAEQEQTSSTNTSTNATMDSENETERAEIDAFRTKVCNVQTQVMSCIFDAGQALIQDTEGCGSGSDPLASKGQVRGDSLVVNDQRYLVKEQMEAIVGQYDLFCAHPCRLKLIDKMRSCYEKFDLDPQIFLSKKSGGAAIGSDDWEVETFCGNRELLVQCLYKEKDECPESDLVLNAIGLDLPMMEKGFEVLCQHQQTYLESLECFETHTPAVGICHSLKHRDVIRVASQAHDNNWTREQYMQAICDVRLRHISCDLDAWAEKQDGTCSQSTLDLKRKLHCILIPEQCAHAREEELEKVCNPKVPRGGAPSGSRLNFHSIFLNLFFACLCVNSRLSSLL